MLEYQFMRMKLKNCCQMPKKSAANNIFLDTFSNTRGTLEIVRDAASENCMIINVRTYKGCKSRSQISNEMHNHKPAVL